MKSVKWHKTEGMELPNQEKNQKSRRKRSHKYLGKLEADTIKKVEMQEIFFLKSVSQKK